MSNKDWIVLLGITGFGMAFANWIGFDVAFSDSFAGVIILLLISFCAVVLDRLIPVRLPVIAYASLVGMLVACPISPVSAYVIDAVGKINFTAPLTMVGAFAGMSISNQLKTFAKQGWKMILISIFVMTGTFMGSLCVSEIILRVTGAV